MAVLAIVVAPALSYFAVVRRLSGKVATSEAADLWKEAQAMREDYRARLAASSDRIHMLEERVEELRDELRTCRTVLLEVQAKLGAT